MEDRFTLKIGGNWEIRIYIEMKTYAEAGDRCSL